MPLMRLTVADVNGTPNINDKMHEPQSFGDPSLVAGMESSVVSGVIAIGPNIYLEQRNGQANRGDDINLLLRSRYVGKEYNDGPVERLFAGMPPLEALRAPISEAATIDGKEEKVVKIDGGFVRRGTCPKFGRSSSDEPLWHKRCHNELARRACQTYGRPGR